MSQESNKVRRWLEPANHSQNDAYATLTGIRNMSAKKVSADPSREVIIDTEVATASKQPGECRVFGRDCTDVHTCHLGEQSRFTELGLNKGTQNRQRICAAVGLKYTREVDAWPRHVIVQMTLTRNQPYVR